MHKAKALQEMLRRHRKPGDLVFAEVFLLFSLFLMGSLGDQVVWAKGTKFFAQPSFWSYAGVFTMAGFGALHLLSSALSPRVEGRWSEVAFWLRAVEFGVWFMIYVIAVPRLGYLPATILFCLLLSFRLGYRTWKPLTPAAGVALFTVVLFKSLLQVKVPGGQLYEHMPAAMRSFMLTYF